LKPQACISPLPRTLDQFHTKQGYAVTYLLAIKIFHKTSSAALLEAERIATSIRKNKWAIPFLNEDGSAVGDRFDISKIECSVIADNVAAINLEWTRNYPFVS
jgi:hypothetical protein